MPKTKHILHVTLGFFVAAEIVLAVLLQTAGGRAAVHASYTVVALSALCCLLFAARTWAYLLTQMGLCFTLLADYFLVLAPTQQQLPAMLFFSVVQLAYAARLYMGHATRRRGQFHLYFRIGLSLFALLLTAVVLRERTDALSLVSLFYFANLIVNILMAFAQWKKSPLFAVGLLLFACCDVVVGLSCIDPYFDIAATSLLYRIIHPGFHLAWAFYVPAKILLPLSLYPTAYKEKFL